MWFVFPFVYPVIKFYVFVCFLKKKNPFFQAVIAAVFFYAFCKRS